MDSFQEFPLALRNESGAVKIVKTPAEENALAAQGWSRPGQANPSAFVRAQDQGGEPPEHQEFPRFNAATGQVESDPHAPAKPPIGMYPKYLNGKVLLSEEDEIEHMIAADEEARIPAADRASEKERLYAAAAERGLRVDARWGIERLRNVVNGPHGRDAA